MAKERQVDSDQQPGFDHWLAWFLWSDLITDSLISALTPATEERLWANYLTPLSLIKCYMYTLIEPDKMVHDHITKYLVRDIDWTVKFEK